MKYNNIMNLVIIVILLFFVTNCRNSFEASSLRTIESINEKLKENPKDIYEYGFRAKCYYDIMQYEKSLDDLNYVIANDPNNKEFIASYYKSKILLLKGDIENSKKVVEDYLKKDDRPIYNYQLGVIADYEENFDEAEKNYQIYLDNTPTAFKYKYKFLFFLKRKLTINLVLINKLEEKDENKIFLYDHFEKRVDYDNTTDYEYQYLLSYYQYTRGKFGLSRGFLNIVIKFNDEFNPAYILYAENFKNEGNAKEARRYLEKGIDEGYDNPAIKERFNDLLTKKYIDKLENNLKENKNKYKTMGKNPFLLKIDIEKEADLERLK